MTGTFITTGAAAKIAREVGKSARDKTSWNYNPIECTEYDAVADAMEELATALENYAPDDDEDDPSW